MLAPATRRKNVMSTKDEYVRRMHTKLEQWNAEIDTLAARVDQLETDARAGYRKQIETLRGKRDDARRQLDTLQQSGESAWQDMKAGVEIAWDAIGEALNSARSRFK